MARARFLPARVSARFLSQGRGGEAEAGQFPVVADEDMSLGEGRVRPGDAAALVELVSY